MRERVPQKVSLLYAFLNTPRMQASNTSSLSRSFRDAITSVFHGCAHQVPEAALNIALQEDKYHKHIQDMNLMLKSYDALVCSLSQVESRLLSMQLEHIQAVIHTGFSPLNWNSQRIPSFIETCNKALNEFSGIVSQIHKSSTMIQEVVYR